MKFLCLSMFRKSVEKIRVPSKADRITGIFLHEGHNIFLIILDVLLTVHLSIILVIDQLNALILVL